MSLTDLINKLSTCQVLHSGDELYEELTEMESHNDKNSIDEYEFMTSQLERNGFHLAYNHVEDCYVVY